MTDTTDKTLMTAMLVIAVMILALLLVRGASVSAYPYRFQQANVSGGVFYGERTAPAPFYTTDTVVAYSRPSRYTTFGEHNTRTTTYTYVQYHAQQPQYSYQCDNYTCWTTP